MNKNKKQASFFLFERVIIQISIGGFMTNKFRIQLERVENGYIVVTTFDGTSFNDYNTTTVIKQDINQAVDAVLKEVNKATVTFATMDDKGSL